MTQQVLPNQKPIVIKPGLNRNVLQLKKIAVLNVQTLIRKNVVQSILQKNAAAPRNNYKKIKPDYYLPNNLKGHHYDGLFLFRFIDKDVSGFNISTFNYFAKHTFPGHNAITRFFENSAAIAMAFLANLG